MQDSERMHTPDLSPKYSALAARIEAHFGEQLVRLPSSVAELGYQVDADAIVDVCAQLRDHPELKFVQLMDVCGVDYLSYGRAEWDTSNATGTGFSRGVTREPADFMQTPRAETVKLDPPSRFAVAYHLLSLDENCRLRLKVYCSDDERPMVPSVVSVWSSAEWFEREAFDLFGILFRGHPDLRRLLTDYGFIGHPFRKDFPLVGNVEMRYDPKKGRVVYEPVSIVARTLVPKVIRDDARYEQALKGTDDA
jgi:NADH-quinone oxidoreductase subunit C